MKIIYLGAFFLSLLTGWILSADSFAPERLFSKERLCLDYYGRPDIDSGSLSVGESNDEFVWVPGGEGIVGNDKVYVDPESGRMQSFPEERGAFKTRIEGFWISRHEVTNAQFDIFAIMTGYKTVAEREESKGSWIFNPLPKGALSKEDVESLNSSTRVGWEFDPLANWRLPEGKRFGEKRDKQKFKNFPAYMRHWKKRPVVHVTLEDALAYANWRGLKLPTEEQWEYAAKLGNSKNVFVRRTPFGTKKIWLANTWQGKFPGKDLALDGHEGIAPVGCFPPNDLGVYDMLGNVWEIVDQNFSNGHFPQIFERPRPSERARRLENSKADGVEVDGRKTGEAFYVLKGGSYLCSPNYCMRYRPSARFPGDPNRSTEHTGFRLVKRP